MRNLGHCSGAYNKRLQGQYEGEHGKRPKEFQVQESWSWPPSTITVGAQPSEPRLHVRLYGPYDKVEIQVGDLALLHRLYHLSAKSRLSPIRYCLMTKQAQKN